MMVKITNAGPLDLASLVPGDMLVFTALREPEIAIFIAKDEDWKKWCTCLFIKDSRPLFMRVSIDTLARPSID